MRLARVRLERAQRAVHSVRRSVGSVVAVTFVRVRDVRRARLLLDDVCLSRGGHLPRHAFDASKRLALLNEARLRVTRALTRRRREGPAHHARGMLRRRLSRRHPRAVVGGRVHPRLHPLRLGVRPGARLGGVARKRVLSQRLLARRAALSRAPRAAAVAADPVPELGELAVERDGGELDQRLAHERAQTFAHQQVLRVFVAHGERQRAPDKLAHARVLAVSLIGDARLLQAGLDDVEEPDAENRLLRVRPAHAGVGPQRVRGFGFDVDVVLEL
mmetsp:Transcript_15268/g.65390  ORF Transcript_15268/g.65390 Transcript_15268/m.65390 type:complete len:274 (+) Transcript_15268:646-1467(+)